MRHNTRKAVFGKPANYYENPRMIARSQKLRVGRYVRIREDVSWNLWVHDQLSGKVGVIIDIRPYMWDALVKFSGTKRQGGLFAVYKDSIEVVK